MFAETDLVDVYSFKNNSEYEFCKCYQKFLVKLLEPSLQSYQPLGATHVTITFYQRH